MMRPIAFGLMVTLLAFALAATLVRLLERSSIPPRLRGLVVALPLLLVRLAGDTANSSAEDTVERAVLCGPILAFALFSGIGIAIAGALRRRDESLRTTTFLGSAAAALGVGLALAVHLALYSQERSCLRGISLVLGLGEKLAWVAPAPMLLWCGWAPRRILVRLVAPGALFALAAGLFWFVGTETGDRWLLAPCEGK